MPKKKNPRKLIAAVQDALEKQRRRALRPTLPVNTHAPVSKSRAETELARDKKRAQRRDWEDS
jgi:hypothetical protein